MLPRRAIVREVPKPPTVPGGPTGAEWSALTGDVTAAQAAIARVDPGTTGDERQTLGWTNAGVPVLLKIREVDPTHPHYGAVGDDSNDDTEAIQAALDEIVTSDTAQYQVALPPGIYKVTESIDPPYAYGYHITGAGSGLTTIRQYGDDRPIINMTTDPAMHTFRLADLGIDYATQQTSSESSSAAILLGGDANSEMYNVVIERVRIGNTYRGIVADTTSGNAAVWGVTMRDVLFSQLTGSAIRALDVVGKPNWGLDNIAILNSGGLAATEWAIDVMATELRIRGLDIEGWGTGHVRGRGGAMPIEIDGYHLENSTFTAAGQINYVEDNGAILRNVYAAFTTNMASGELYFLQGFAGHPLELSGATFEVTISDGGEVYPMRTTGSQYLIANSVRGTGLTANPINPSHAASVNALRIIDNLPMGVRLVSSATTLGDRDTRPVSCDAFGGAFTVTLPSIATNAGATIAFVKTDNTENAVTISAASGEYIDANGPTGTRSLDESYASLTLMCDGSKWLTTSTVGTVT